MGGGGDEQCLQSSPHQSQFEIPVTNHDPKAAHRAKNYAQAAGSTCIRAEKRPGMGDAVLE